MGQYELKVTVLLNCGENLLPKYEYMERRELLE